MSDSPKGQTLCRGLAPEAGAHMRTIQWLGYGRTSADISNLEMESVLASREPQRGRQAAEGQAAGAMQR